ncbi:hypothetical protein [Paractinoplanes toevensis]|nr:hypothetical protein [Actinoplanes toevensis]
MKTQTTVLALAATTLVILSGCKAGSSPSAASTTGAPTETTAAAAAGDNPAPAKATATVTTTGPVTAEPGSTSSPKAEKTTKPAPTATKPTDSGPTIVSFKLVQKPKCPEGTAVFRAPAVPAIIKWKITGADSAALSVDDPTHTPGTYGPEPLSGTEEFQFSCAGEVGSVEKHTYAIWALGGGKQHSKTITATAKILDNGKS